ncbi:aspartate/glutamate racemase family protein [uncultured Sphaerochaeta sp.]|uniref:aspartate/glutamate racemase family protein n=1 Tax=uncultured Sphaerochaeta sp. TaxID=886478 RepID=UPI002A0A597A|nr:aspartate/glutamate racemase family protein [uncultured Sphaerochaeta sp.]
MKRVALIHTVRPVLGSFPELLENVVGQKLKIHNILDDFLASDPAEIGYFSLENRKRLFNDLQSCELTKPDVIVVTCSTLTPAVQLIRPFINVPIVAIDDAMTEKAVRIGKKIKVVATAMSTLEPTISKLNQEAAIAGTEIEVDAEDNEPAYTAMRSGDMETHNRLVLEMIKQVKGYDCIVLAQASMGHLQEEAEKLAGVPVLASPVLCCEKVKNILEGEV